MLAMEGDNNFRTEVQEATEAVDILLRTAASNEKQLMNLASHVKGVQALTNRIQTEVKVLQRGLLRPNWLKLEHVISSNLHHLGAVVQVASALSDQVDGVLQKYSDDFNRPLFIDVVANGGLLWIKVVCRCPNTLQLAHCTGGRTGERNPLDQARAMLNLAAQHPVLYATPRVAFVFCKGVSATVQDALCREGVLVCTPRVIADSLLPASQYLPGVDDYDTQNDAVKFSEMHNNTNSFIGCEDQIKKISSINNYHDDVIGSINGTGEESETFQNENLILLEHCNDLHTNIHFRLRQTIAPFNKEPHENLFPSHSHSTSTSSENNGQFFGCHDDSNDLQKINTSFSDDLHNPGTKMPWPMCSNEEIFEMCFELRKYSNKSDLARKAMKSRTFVSLCDNSHFSESNYNRDNLNKTVLSPPVREQLRTEGRSQAEFSYVESILSSPSCQEPQINQQYPRPELENSSESSVDEDHVSSSVDSSEIADSALSKTSMEKQESLKLLLPLNVKLEKNLNLESEPDSIVSAAESAVETIKCSKKLGSSNLCHDTESAVDSLSSTNSIEISHHENSCRKQVCLDVPTMIAYIANTSNGYSHCLFEDKFLRQQALWEQEEPVKPVIEKYWRDCEILVCREALMRFESIVGVMAGEQELQRAKQLVQRLTIVPDQDVLKGVLRVCGGITVSSRIIFGTALHHRAPIITANRRFVRSAHSQGLLLAALLHNPRALTEQKQLLAVGIKTPLAPGPDEVSRDRQPGAWRGGARSKSKGNQADKSLGLRAPPKKVLSCLSSAKYISAVTPVSLLSSD